MAITPNNAAIAARLEAFAALLELADASPYSPPAYRPSAQLPWKRRDPVSDVPLARFIGTVSP